MFRLQKLTYVVLALAVLIACNSDSATGPNNDAVALATAHPTSVRTGDSILATVVLSSQREQPVPLIFTGVSDRQYVELFVTNLRGDVIAQSRDWSGTLLAAYSRLLKPGEEMSWEVTWLPRDAAGRPLPPGQYQLYSTVLGEVQGARRDDFTREGMFVSARTRFEITP